MLAAQPAKRGIQGYSFAFQMQDSVAGLDTGRLERTHHREQLKAGGTF